MSVFSQKMGLKTTGEGSRMYIILEGFSVATPTLSP